MQYNSSCCVLDIHKIMQIAYSENFQALFRHVNDVGADAVHEILRVRDDNKNATIPENTTIYKRAQTSWQQCLYKMLSYCCKYCSSQTQASRSK